MKIKNIFKFLIFALLAMQLGSCNDNTDAEQKFDQNPTDRLNAQKKELSDVLLTSEHGWKAVYFTDNTQLGGFTHLFKFSSDGKVEMASDFDGDTDAYESAYSVELGSAVSLLFTTKNRIHLLSDSDNSPTDALEGKGYKGDFQFLYYGQENGEIIFKTNRSFQELRFVKATEEDWENLAQNVIMGENVVGGEERPLFRLLETNDGTTTHQFDFIFSEAPRFASANSIETGYAVSYNMGIAYTPTGISVSPAVEVKGQKLTDFVYNDTDGSFTATGTGGVSATIKYTTKPLILTDDYKGLLDGNDFKVYGYISPFLTNAITTSTLCKELLDEINASLPATQQLTRVQLYFNDGGYNYIEYRFSGGRPTLYHNVTTSENAVDKTIVLTHDSWQTATALIPAPALLKKIDDEFTNPKGLYVKKENFKVVYSNVVWTFTSASSNFRITTYALN
ncbi:DUF4302 domain-containing protein [Flavobacterium sp. GA093]|uniref:DUF4302 domain-containing protein n=1 Tax=Flavobacterium hydrocarbonoxydans TaxID=2683249 RepID=A0A6I4NHK9_9FLAO|nr:DUF4302 domain-containing protein [Flavobacterium hydrocarbonoxydans]MWB93956.1 DUF4302 domain-containing protein [Flavobacterium hydrocarbonoxydans]